MRRQRDTWEIQKKKRMLAVRGGVPPEKKKKKGSELGAAKDGGNISKGRGRG